MSGRRRTGRCVGAVLVLVFALVGCGSTTQDTSESASEPGATTAWATAQLSDVDGEQFTIDGLAGKPVVVENFATWCSNCLRQLGDTQKAAAAAGDDAVFLALSVETDIDPADVKAYAKEHGFANLRFAVMTPEFLAKTKEAFGTTALNPPATPKIVVDADGVAGKAVTGFETPDEIAERITASE